MRESVFDEEELGVQPADAEESMPSDPADLQIPGGPDLPAPATADPEPAPAPDAPDLMQPEAAVLDAPAAVPAAVAPDPAALVGKGGSSIKRPIITPQETAAVESIPGITRSKVAAARQGETVDIAKAGVEQTRLDKQAEIERKYLEDQARIRAEQEKIIAERKAKLDAQIEANDGRKMHDYFSTERGGNRVLAAIMGALGGFNQRYNGGVNIGTQAVKQKIEEDYRLQKDEIDREFRKEVRLRGDVATAEKERDQALHNLDVNKIGQYRAAGAEAAAQLQRQGVPAIQAKTNKLTADLEEEGTKTYVGLLQKQHGEITNNYKAPKGTGGGRGGDDVEALIRRMVAAGESGEAIARATAGKIAPKERGRIMASEEALARERKGEATTVSKEITDALKPVIGKGGIRESQQHLDSSIRKLEANPTNPVEWTNAIDASIRTNTGRAAIKAQYDLYRSHAGGSAARFEDWIESFKSGNPGAETVKNLMGSFKSSLAELQREGGEAERNFRENYIADPRVANNPTARAAFEAAHKSAFGTMHGGENIGRAGVPKEKPAEEKPEAGKPAELTTAQRARLVTIRDDPSKPAEVRARARALLKAK